MRPTTIALASGCLLGGGIAVLVTTLRGGAETTQRSGERQPALSRAVERIGELEETERRLGEEVARNAELQAALDEKIETLERERDMLKAAAAGKKEETPAGPLTQQELEDEVEAFGAGLQAIIPGSDEGREVGERLRAALARTEPGAVAGLVKQFQDPSQRMERRIVLAHVLGQSELPEALEALKGVLRDPDSGMLAHRFASHGLAFSSAEGIDPFLADVARNAADNGVRANAAFGLNRRGVEEGMELYLQATDAAFEKGDPAALQYLGGLVLMGDRAKPGVRERLLTYKDEQAVLTLIGLVQRSGDKEALENLAELAYDSSQPRSVQKAAGGAIKALEGGS